jgi:hypothetical protein
MITQLRRTKPLIHDYLEEWLFVGWESEMMQRRDVIKYLESVTDNRGAIDMYLMSLDLRMERMTGAVCDLYPDDEHPRDYVYTQRAYADMAGVAR